MTTILTDKFAGSRTLPGTVSGWNYELTITKDGNVFTVAVTEIPGNPANARTTTHVAVQINGVFYWQSKPENPLSEAVCKETFIARIPSYDANRQSNEYAVHMAAFVTAYRAAEANRKPSMEERYELTAAYGFDKTVVNVLSGRKTRTLSRKVVR